MGSVGARGIGKTRLASGPGLMGACCVPLARMVGGLAPTHGVAADEGKGVERVQPTGVGPEPKGLDVAREARSGGRPGHLTHTNTKPPSRASTLS